MWQGRMSASFIGAQWRYSQPMGSIGLGFADRDIISQWRQRFFRCCLWHIQKGGDEEDERNTRAI